MSGCAEPKVTPPSEPEAPPAEAPPVLTEVRLPPLRVVDPFRWDQEFRGLATATLELGLADLPGVVPVVPGDGAPPSLLGERPRGQRQVDATFTCAGSPEALTLTLGLCVAGGGCDEVRATAPREAPYPAFAALLAGAAEVLEVAVDEPTRAAWAAPGAKDPYAELIAGRAAAAYYGFLPPSEAPGDRRKDPVARAPFLAPTQPVSQWIAARWALGTSTDATDAVGPLGQARAARPGSPLLAADLAAVYTLAGRPDQAALVWDELALRLGDDPRWFDREVATWLAVGRAPDARRRLDRLSTAFTWEPTFARARVRVAEALGETDLDPLLEHWQAADSRAVEPVRRRLDLRVARGDYADALPLVAALRSRAPGPPTDALEAALLTAVGRYEEAAQLVSPEVAARLRARAARAADAEARIGALLPPGDAAGRLADAEAALLAREAPRALELADAVLAEDERVAEAWQLRARALEALGRGDAATVAWRRAWALDPALPGGPVEDGRVLSTFQVAVVSRSETVEPTAGPRTVLP